LGPLGQQQQVDSNRDEGEAPVDVAPGRLDYKTLVGTRIAKSSTPALTDRRLASEVILNPLTVCLRQLHKMQPQKIETPLSGWNSGVLWLRGLATTETDIF